MSYSFFPHQGDESYTSAFTVVTVVREAKAPPEVIKPFTDRCYGQAQAEVTARDKLIVCQATWRADHEEVEEQDKALGQTVAARAATARSRRCPAPAWPGRRRWPTAHRAGSWG